MTRLAYLTVLHVVKVNMSEGAHTGRSKLSRIPGKRKAVTNGKTALAKLPAYPGTTSEVHGLRPALAVLFVYRNDLSVDSPDTALYNGAERIVPWKQSGFRDPGIAGADGVSSI